MKSIQETTIPPSVTATLWSYNPGELDAARHKQLIISAVLNYGTKAATDWLFNQYGQTEIASVAARIPEGAWDKRSLSLWSAVLDIHPRPRQERFA